VTQILGSFPGEVGIFTAEVTERGRLPIDGALEVELLDDHAWTEIEIPVHNFLEV